MNSLALPPAAWGRPARRRWPDAPVLLAASAAEAAAALLAPDAMAWMLVHAGIMTLLWGVLRLGGARRARITPLFLLATALLGPIGAAGSLCSALLLRLWTRAGRRPDAWSDMAQAEQGQRHAQALHRRVQRDAGNAPLASSVAPFIDVLAKGSVAQKQAVVALIVGRFEPGLAPALRAALNDAEPAVRVLAASGTARIENQIMATTMALEQQRATDPDNAALTWSLARHHDDHANTGLLDPARAQAARSRALELYRDCQRLRPGAVVVLVAVMRLLVRMGRDAEAVATLAPLVQGGNAPAEALTWYVECLFRLRRYTVLGETCRILHARRDALEGLSERCREVVALWAAGGASSGPLP